MLTPDEMRAKIVDKATDDADFRARLFSDPKGAIEAALGVHVPDAMAVRVHQEDVHTAHLVLPPSSALDLASLEAVAGGFSSAPEELRIENWI